MEWKFVPVNEMRELINYGESVAAPSQMSGESGSLKHNSQVRQNQRRDLGQCVGYGQEALKRHWQLEVMRKRKWR